MFQPNAISKSNEWDSLSSSEIVKLCWILKSSFPDYCQHELEGLSRVW